MTEVRCPKCNKKLAVISTEDKNMNYLQLKCSRCKMEVVYTKGEIKIK